MSGSQRKKDQRRGQKAMTEAREHAQRKRKIPDRAEQSEAAATAGMEAARASEGKSSTVVYYGGDVRGAKAQAAKARTDWAASAQTQQASPAQLQRDAPGNHPVPRRTDQLASGHPISASVLGSPESGQQLDYQQRSTQPGVEVQWGDGPLGSALRQHVSGSASVASMDQARASQPFLHDQLGLRSPMGVSGAPRFPESTASQQPGLPASTPPHQVPASGPGSYLDAGSLPMGDRGMARGFNPPPPVKAPGSEWTSRVPGEGRQAGQ